MSLCPVILAGGSGTRLWPLSRQHFPKQFISMFGDSSMLQQTMLRLEQDGLGISVSPTQVICNEVHRFLVVEQARAIGHPLQQVVLEPVGRNTAPALTVSALSQGNNEDAVLLMMPADHLIKNNKIFRNCIQSAYQEAQKGAVVTFGIRPDRPETGYGYIECSEASTELADIVSFKEKPQLEAAEKYLAEGNYLWNSGLFMMKSSLWLDLIREANPEILDCCSKAIENGKEDGDFFRLDEPAFSSCPSDSIDYAVMEGIGDHSYARARVIAMDAGWSDIGSWDSVWEESDKDENGNASSGDVLLDATKNTLVKAGKRLVSLVGVNDLVVVDTPDAVMIADKNYSQEVKNLVDTLKSTGREEYENHSQVFRPWGSYETLEMGIGFQVKRIVVNPGKRLSLQLHHKRSEHWVVVDGIGTVTLDDKEFELGANESTYIPVESKHRLENKTSKPLTIIEVQVGSYLGEDDIVRFDDDFGRA